MRLGRYIAHVGRPVAQAREEEALMAEARENLSPLFCFERDTIRSAESSGDKSDAQVGGGNRTSRGHITYSSRGFHQPECFIRAQINRNMLPTSDLPAC